MLLFALYTHTVMYLQGGDGTVPNYSKIYYKQWYEYIASVTDMLLKVDLPSIKKEMWSMKMFMYSVVNDVVKLAHSNLIPTVAWIRGHNWCYNPYARTDIFTFILHFDHQTVKQTSYECCPSIAIH